MDRLKGLIAATPTPFHADGSLRLETIDLLAERLVRDKVDGVFPCGTTGEFPSLTVDERLRVGERWCRVAGKGLPVVIHVGGSSLAEAKALAAGAAQAGASAIAAVAPFFFRLAAPGDLVAFLAEIAAAAPGLPFFYYHIPSLSRVPFSAAEVLELAAERIPTLAGVKYSDLDLVDLGRCVALGGGRLNVLFGVDEALLAGIALGARGAVGATYSFAAPLSRGILAAVAAGDLNEARALQARSRDFIAVFQRYRGHPGMKAAMKLSGIDCGPVRPPQRPLSAEEHAAMARELAAAGWPPGLEKDSGSS
jgi:N-acetylneuraminate lyase